LADGESQRDVNDTAKNPEKGKKMKSKTPIRGVKKAAQNDQNGVTAGHRYYSTWGGRLKKFYGFEGNPATIAKQTGINAKDAELPSSNLSFKKPEKLILNGDHNREYSTLAHQPSWVNRIARQPVTTKYVDKGKDNKEKRKGKEELYAAT